MTQIGIMIEGQDGLNWARWQRLLRTAEDCGYQCVFRSDHFTNPVGEDKDSLELWISLAYAASHTSRIEFGPLVAPITFRHPSMNARYAAAIDDLSGGRLVLGMGAGWQDREHTKFGIAFHDFSTRYKMLEDALELTQRLLRSDTPSDFGGEYYQLEGRHPAAASGAPGRTTHLDRRQRSQEDSATGGKVRRRMERGLSQSGRHTRKAPRADRALFAGAGSRDRQHEFLTDDTCNLSADASAARQLPA